MDFVSGAAIFSISAQPDGQSFRHLKRMDAVAVLRGHHNKSVCNKWFGEKELKLFKLVGPPLVAAAVALSPISSPLALAVSPPGQTIDAQRGASLFHRACIGCHDAGGNIIQPGATLFLKDLQRNGVDTEEEIYRVIYFGKGRMPGFGEKCTPRGQCTFGPRLQEDEIKLLAEFVKAQADKDWPAIPEAD